MESQTPRLHGNAHDDLYDALPYIVQEFSLEIRQNTQLMLQAAETGGLLSCRREATEFCGGGHTIGDAMKTPTEHTAYDGSTRYCFQAMP